MWLQRKQRSAKRSSTRYTCRYETRYFPTQEFLFFFFSTVSLYCSARVIDNWLTPVSAVSPRCSNACKRTQTNRRTMVRHVRLLRPIRHPLSLFDNWKNAIKNLNGNIGQRHSHCTHPPSPYPSVIKRSFLTLLLFGSCAHVLSPTFYNLAEQFFSFLFLFSFENSI